MATSTSTTTRRKMTTRLPPIPTASITTSTSSHLNSTSTTPTTPPSMTIDATHIPSKLLLQLTTTNIPARKPASPNSRPSTPTSHTAPLTTFTTRPRSCYLCDEENPGDFSPTITHLETCVLCARPFCPIHQTLRYTHNTHNAAAPVCNINHSRYYHARLARARLQVANDESGAEDMLVRAGVFPSLGERERAVWRIGMSSTLRTYDGNGFKEALGTNSDGGEARIATHDSTGGCESRRASTPVETKELVGADIAV